MAELPTGTMTFLFTDLEGSTRLWEQHGEAMQAALARHDEILYRAVELHHGHVVKSTGDGIHAVFEAADDALGAAVEAQRELASEAWGETGPLRVRMGLHTGTAERRGGDYFGSALNRAARVMAVAHGGQVLVSHATQALVQDSLPGGLSLLDLGEHRLRDLSRPERISQVHGAGLDSAFAPLRSLDAFPGNLPLQVSSFIGRQRELARVIEALGEARVVTLTGVGGVGKTRLALQVAAESLPRFREGAWLVELAAVRDPEGVVGAVAGVFGVTARAGHGLIDTLVEFLGTKQLLLILDNCEHLLEAVADLVDVIERSCGGVVVLATSREGLALEGERVLPIPSLPGPAAGADLEATRRADAVHLFVERAHDVDPDFELSAANAGAVAQVCRRLDGVPLAIELAAARVRAMSPAELARGLDRRFDMLAGGRRRAVQRHQTLRAAIDWSYELCSEPERRLLARLAVFAGGCTRDAAEVVCAGPPIAPGRVFESLTGLVDRSLVVAERDQPETRYRLLETIREYGEERLAEHDETETLRDRHAEYLADLLASFGDERVYGPDQIEVGRRVSSETENLFAAMNHAIDRDDAGIALRLLQRVATPGFAGGYSERMPADPVLSLTGATEHPLYPSALAAAAWQAAVRGDVGDALARCEHAVDAADRLGDPDGVAHYLVSLARASAAFSHGAWLEAANYFERGAEIGRSAARPAWVASSLASAAFAHTMAGDPSAAVPLATEGLAEARRTRMPTVIITNLNGLAGALADEDPDHARALLRETLELAASLDADLTFYATNTLLTAARLGDWAQTLALAPTSIRFVHWNNESPQLAGVLNVVARCLVSIDAEAAAVLQGAARRQAMAAIPTPDRTATARSTPPLNPSGSTNRPPGNAGFIAELRRSTTNLLRATLGESRVRELRAEGEALDSDRAVAYALDAINRAG